jgi:hypothetical protein
MEERGPENFTTKIPANLAIPDELTTWYCLIHGLAALLVTVSQSA